MTQSSESRPSQSGFFWLGVLLIVLGVLAIVFPLVSTLAVTIWLGGLLAAAGLVTVWRAFAARPWGRAAVKGVWGLLYVTAGAILLFEPLTGAASLSLLLAALFILSGAAQIAWALSAPRPPAWGWMIASGAISLLLGVMVAGFWQDAALWFPGTLAGIDLVSTGAAFLAIDRAAKQLAP